MNQISRASGLSLEETALSWSAAGVLAVATAFTLGVLFVI